MKKLKIAQVGSFWFATPPKKYGGTERVVHEITEELVKKGHDVTLFATGDSKTSAKLKYTFAEGARPAGVPWENFLYPLDHIANVFQEADKYDIIHIHLNRSQDYAALLFAGLVKTPTIFTLHFKLAQKKDKNLKDRYEFLTKYKDRNYISISNAQRTLPLHYAATVYNGLNFDRFIPSEKPGKNLVWLGRICHEKGTLEAIEIAKKTGMNLLIAGTLDRTKYADYIDKVFKEVDGKQIKYVGEVNDKQKIALLKKAKVLLNPINWNEPFGLVVIEAMAMGVPVIAFDQGPMKEIIMQGKTGFVVKNIPEMIKALGKVDTLNRKLIRQYTLSHFSSTVMAENYEKVYQEVIRKHSHK